MADGRQFDFAFPPLPLGEGRGEGEYLSETSSQKENPLTLTLSQRERGQEFRAGAASIKITPDEPMWLAGFAVRTEPAKGKLSDLFVKAMAIEDSRGKRIVIVSMDLIAISRSVAHTVSVAARERFGLSRDQLLLCATHTHYGPELRPDKVPFFHIPDEYAAKIQPFADRLAEIIVEAIGQSLDRLGPTTLRIADTRVSFAANRRGADDPIDHSVPILIAEGVGIVFGYACHNTTMPPADCLYSGDWAGFAAEELERQYPRHVALFLAGAGADQNPTKGTADVSRAHGHALADAIIQSECSELIGEIRSAFAEVKLDFQALPSIESIKADRSSDDQPRRTKAEFLLDALRKGHKFDASYPCPIQVIRFGDQLLLIAIGGEPVIDYAANLKREFAGGGKLVWIVGYANDMFGYVPTPRVLRGGGYEGTRSVLWSALPMPFTESVEERVMDTARKLVKQL
jgi:neutral ceramidase